VADSTDYETEYDELHRLHRRDADLDDDAAGVPVVPRSRCAGGSRPGKRAAAAGRRRHRGGTAAGANPLVAHAAGQEPVPGRGIGLFVALIYICWE
jgi:hypothetical protein